MEDKANGIDFGFGIYLQAILQLESLVSNYLELKCLFHFFYLYFYFGR